MINDLVYIDGTGFHYPDYPTILLSLKEQYRLIYGQDIDLDADTLDGQFLAVMAQCHFDMAQTLSFVYNGFSPATATGDALSRQVRINGIARMGGTKSTVDVKVTGQSGTLIQNGVVEDLLGNKWSLPNPVQILSSGEKIVTATAQEFGSISAQIGTITKIATPTLGWQAVANTAVASVGRDVETDAELRIRQANSVAVASQSLLASVYGAVSNVVGVKRLKVYENDTALTDINGVTRNSIAVVVEGGTTPEIAAAIFNSKSLGCGTFGAVNWPVVDTQNQVHGMKFSYVTSKAIKLKVTITPLSKYSSSSNDLIKKNLLGYIKGHEIGETLYYGQLMAVAYQTQSQYFETFNISKIEISVDGGAYTTNTDVPCTIFQAVAMALASDVEVILI